MIASEDHPEILRAATELGNLLGLLARRRPVLDHETLRQILSLRDEHRLRWRTLGVDFPRLVVIALPRFGTHSLELWRKDLNLANLRIKIVNLVKLHPTVAPTEIAAALKAAYPSLRPGDLLRTILDATHKTDAVDTAGARRIEDEVGRLN